MLVLRGAWLLCCTLLARQPLLSLLKFWVRRVNGLTLKQPAQEKDSKAAAPPEEVNLLQSAWLAKSGLVIHCLCTSAWACHSCRALVDIVAAWSAGGWGH